MSYIQSDGLATGPMKLLAEYQVWSVPRLSSAKHDDDYRNYDTFFGLRALWNALIFQMVRKYGVTVELRYARPAGSSRGLVSLRLHGEPQDGMADELRQVEKLLPGEYRWDRRMSDATLADHRWRIARVVRRIEFMDLPTFTLSPHAGDRPVPATELRISSSATSMVFPLWDAGMRRAIPTVETMPNELRVRPLCLPLPGRLTAGTPRFKALFQGFQRVDEGVMSICLHPLPDSQRLGSQRIALGLQRFLEPFRGNIENMGFTDEVTAHSAFRRFALPRGYLFNMSIRVGAKSNEAAVGLANLLAEIVGGANAFQVIAPSRDAAEASLTDPELDVPSTSWSPARLASADRRLERELGAQEVERVTDRALLDFLLRMPHVYSISEAGWLLRLPVADDEGLPGLDSHVLPPFTVPSLDFLPVRGADGDFRPAPPGRLRIGMIERPGIALDTTASGAQRFRHHGWHLLDAVELTKHAFIVGSTGSGKTMTTTFLVRELDRLGIPVLIIEPVKTEYFDKLSGVLPHLRRWRLEGDAKGKRVSDYLAFDPLRVPYGITVARHCSYLKSCFEAAFALQDFMAVLLENGLRVYYEQECGLSTFRRGGKGTGKIRSGRVYPSFDTFCDFFTGKYLLEELASLRQSRNAGDAATVIDAFRRRFVNLKGGLLGEVFRNADDQYLAGKPYNLFPSYLQSTTVIELDAVADADQKSLLMSFLLTLLFEHRQAEDFKARRGGEPIAEGLRHFLVVEEAHRLLASGVDSRRGADTVGESSQAKAVQLFVDMLAEVRAFGQGLAIVEQIPTKIVSEAVKNTNLKIMLRLTAKDDREYLGEAMNFTEEQMRFVTNLKVERGRQVNFVVFEEGVEQPLLLSLPLPEPGQLSHDPYVDLFPARNSPS